MIIFAGNPVTPTGKIIRLIKEDNHYDGCNSFAGTGDTITKTSVVIPVKANAAPPANAWTVPISSRPNDP